MSQAFFERSQLAVVGYHVNPHTIIALAAEDKRAWPTVTHHQGRSAQRRLVQGDGACGLRVDLTAELPLLVRAQLTLLGVLTRQLPMNGDHINILSCRFASRYPRLRLIG